MEPKRWIGSHDWKRANDVIDGYPSRNERSQTDTEDLDDLINWLEYGKTSGYIAARNSKEQEEHWATLLRNLLCKDLIKELMFFGDNTFRVRCALCNNELSGTITKDGHNIGIDTIPCEHLKDRFLDIIQYILNQYEEWK